MSWPILSRPHPFQMLLPAPKPTLDSNSPRLLWRLLGRRRLRLYVSKVLVLIRFHWGVFGHYYVASSNTTEEASERPSATGMAMASKSGASSQQQQRLQQHSKNDNSKPNASTGSSSADNKITQKSCKFRIEQAC